MSDSLLSFIGVAVGSLLTLLVTWISNRHGLKLQKSQLEFESRERQRERQLQMRLDVYLPAADAIVGMAACIGRAINPNIGEAEFATVSQSFSVAIARVQTVASEETIRQVSALHRAYTRELIAVMRDRHSIVLRQSDIDFANSKSLLHQEELGRYVEMMRAFNRDDRTDTERWNAIQDQSDYIEEVLDATISKLDALAATQLAEQSALAKTILARMEPLLALQIPALAAIRTELELPGASTVLTQELQATVKELQKALGQALDTFSLPLSE